MSATVQSLPVIALRASTISDALQAHQAVIEPGFVALGRHLGDIQDTASNLLVQSAPGPSVVTDETRRAEPAIAVHARALLERATAIAYQVQFGDLIRQKHEHVVTALRDIARWLAAATPQLDSHLRATEADCLLALQSSQLEAIRHDVVFIGKHLLEHFSFVRSVGDALVALVSDGDLRRITRELPSELAFLEEFAGALDRELESIEDLRSSLQPWLITGLDASTLLARSATRYTMSAEWHVHRHWTGPSAGETSSGANDVSFF